MGEPDLIFLQKKVGFLGSNGERKIYGRYNFFFLFRLPKTNKYKNNARFIGFIKYFQIFITNLKRSFNW